VIDQVSRVYRNIRNRVRFMLSNVDDLAVEGVVARDSMHWYDRLACTVTDRWVEGVYEHLRNFRLHDAYLEILRFEGDDLSGFYFNALKDRLYSSAPLSHRRRSAQSAILHILEQFLSVLAPLLSFTAEEAWQALPAHLRGERASVFDLSPHYAKHRDTEAQSAWDEIKRWRGVVAANKAQDYELVGTLALPSNLYEVYSEHADDVREALVLSALTLEQGDARLTVAPAGGQKCRRCWKYLPLGSDPKHPALCASCAEIVESSV